MLVGYLIVITVLAHECVGDGDLTKTLAAMVNEVAHNGQELTAINADAFYKWIDHTQEELALPDTRTDSNPVVDTTSGRARGATFAEVHAFFEIPYAQPPERYQPPVSLNTPGADINATTNDGTQCMQFESECIRGEDTDTCKQLLKRMKEDCLVLNVYVPSYVNLTNASNPPLHRLPVMFYIHGGSFNAGSGTRSSLDGRYLANVTNTVVVTINYRLGALGFLVHKEEGYDDIEGNQGLKDQQMALQWVQDNIEAFGGDRNEVTLFGNSAGAQSVMFHVVSANSAPLFRRAIQQSNPAVFKYQTPEESIEAVTHRLLKSLNCSGSERECLMDSTAVTISNQQIKVMARSLVAQDVDATAEPYRPVVDGIEYADQPLALFRDGKWNTDKELIIGVNTQELEDIQFYLPDVPDYNENIFGFVNRVMLGATIGPKVSEKYMEEYPPKEGEDYIVTIGIEMSHMFFICPSRAMARFASLTSSAAQRSVYFYANEHPVLDGTCETRNGDIPECYYSTHADEIRYVFRTLVNASLEDQQVTDEFSTYWGSFARTGTPNNDLQASLTPFTNWNAYKSSGISKNPTFPKKDSIMAMFFAMYGGSHLDGAKADGGPWQNIRIKAPIGELETGYEESICDFWDGLDFYVEMDPSGTGSGDKPTTTTPTTTAITTTPTTTAITTTSTKSPETTTGYASKAIPSFALLMFVVLANALHGVF